MEIRDRIKSLRRVAAKDLIANPKNWRTHPVAQADAMRGILADVGFADAVLARETPEGLQLIDGHLRTEVAPDSKLPVLVLDVTEEEADLILATHDPIAAMAGADESSLAALLDGMKFDSDGAQALLDDLADSSGLKPAEELLEDEPPEPPANPVTKPGQLITLGRHRLLCGDCTSTQHVARLMDGQLAAVCFTSPPYLERRDYTDESDCSDWDSLMQQMATAAPLSEDGQLLVNLGLIHEAREWLDYWNDWIEWMRSEGWLRFGFYVWDKMNPHPMAAGGRLLTSHEFVFHFCKKPRAPELMRPNKTAGTSVTPYDMNKTGAEPQQPIITQPFGVRESVARIQKGGAAGHPAAFPLGLAAYFIESWTGLIYEPFAGSGTTLLAAEKLERTCYGMEISPAYCDVIVERWQNLTGEKVKRRGGKNAKR